MLNIAFLGTLKPSRAPCLLARTLPRILSSSIWNSNSEEYLCWRVYWSFRVSSMKLSIKLEPSFIIHAVVWRSVNPDQRFWCHHCPTTLTHWRISDSFLRPSTFYRITASKMSILLSSININQSGPASISIWRPHLSWTITRLWASVLLPSETIGVQKKWHNVLRHTGIRVVGCWMIVIYYHVIPTTQRRIHASYVLMCYRHVCCVSFYVLT